MAPKAADKKKGQDAPPVEEEVVLPPGLAFTDPPFVVSVVHVAGGALAVEGEAAEAGGPGPLVEFDPVAALTARLREPGRDTPRSQRRLLVERADVEALVEGAAPKQPPKKGEPAKEDRQSEISARLAKGLVKKVEAESAGRRLRKVNAARRRAIAEAEGAPQGESDQGQREAAEPDLVLVLVGYPATPQDVRDLAGEGAFHAVSSWVTVHLEGETVVETVVEGAFHPERARQRCEAPALLQELSRLAREAPLGDALANCTIAAVTDCHALALPTDSAGDRILEAALGVGEAEASARLRYDRWLQAAQKVGAERSGGEAVDTRLYSRLADDVPTHRQDTPLLLHCLCEQVALNLSADAVPDLSGGQDEAGRPTGGAGEELDLLEECLDGLHADLCLCDLGDPHSFGARGAGPDAAGPRPEEPPWENCPQDTMDSDLILPYLDRTSCMHPNGELPGGQPVAAAVGSLLARCRAAGVERLGLPPQPQLTAPQRSALRNRLQAFVPEEVPIVEIERMYILEEFGRLLEAAQPERRWRLTDRVFHERIPSSMLLRAMQTASHGEGFVDTAYLPRHDCLLVAMHQRLLPGRVLWHSWMGDFMLPGEGLGSRLCPVPTFGDWRQFVEGAVGGEEAAPRLLEGSDAREIGYCSVVEKVHVPADRSVILQTALNRGLQECAAPPTGGVGPGGGPSVLDAVPLRSCRSARVIKQGIAFGIVSDAAWQRKVARFRARREEKERAAEEAAEAARQAAEEKAQADALRAAQGLPPAEEEEGEEESDDDEEARASPSSQRAVSERLFEDLRFGVFWLTFPDSSRVTCRMQHEKAWYEEGVDMYDVTFGRPCVQVACSASDGLLVQALGDATVRQSLPAQAPAPTGDGLLEGSALLPGGALDYELSRTVSPFGVLVRELLSGRREVHHPDGTRAVRNPTAAEMRSQLDKLSSVGIRRKSREALERMTEACEREYGRGLLEVCERASAEARFAGLPGHWRVTRPDGGVFGRAGVPQPADVPSGPPAGQGEEAGGADASGEEAGGADAGGGDRRPSAEQAALLEMLEGTLTDDGRTIEYEIGEVSVSSLVDPHTGERVASSSEGLLIIDGPEAAGAPRTCLLPDGTRIFNTSTADGYRVTVEKEGLARVICSVSPRAYHPKTPTTFTEVECADGARLQVVPQRLNERGELINSNPSMGQCPEFCTNALIYLRRPDGFVLRSKGDGDVHMVTAPEVALLGEREALLAARESASGSYVVHCDGDLISMKDDDGNHFELRGDQTIDVTLAVAMGDECEEPRCTEPGVPYKHPDARYLPLPDGTPPPRLFVVYGDGEAEELLPSCEVHEALRVAREDPQTMLIEGEAMSAPMQLCRSHTMYRTVPLDPAVVPPTPVVLPPSVAGFEASIPPPPRTYTELRQIVEYPAISDERWQVFQDALARHRAHEESHLAEHQEYGSGLKSGRRLKATMANMASVAEAGA